MAYDDDQDESEGGRYVAGEPEVISDLSEEVKKYESESEEG